jgi:beta-lactamase class A
MRRREALAALGLGACAGPLRAGALVEGGLLSDLLKGAGPTTRRVLADAESFEPQIIWTRLAPAVNGRWRVHAQHRFGVQPRRWFAAASFVKLPLAALVGEYLSESELSEQLPTLQLALDHRGACAPLPAEVSAAWPLLRLLRAMLVVSDNRAYNALYELIGSDALHQRLTALGYGDCRLGARLGCSGRSPGKLAARLLDANGRLLAATAAVAQEDPQRFPHGAALKGRAWMENGRKIAGAHDFSRSNFMPLSDVHRMTLELGSGAAVDDQPAFALDAAMRLQLASIMRMTPRACPDPQYPVTDFHDDHSKWLIPVDASGRLPESLAIASKNAESYGYIGDSAFVHDPARGIAFALSAVLFVDRDGVLNDGRYAYQEIGRPFLRELGSAVLAHERAHPIAHSVAVKAG